MSDEKPMQCLRIPNECKETEIFLERGLDSKNLEQLQKDKKSYLAHSRATKF